MKPSESVQAFTAFAAANGVVISEALPGPAIEQMFLFFESVEPEGCNREEDGDMLLYQWFPSFDEKQFVITLDRQFSESQLQDDDALTALDLCYWFEMTPELEALGSGDRWCHGPAELDATRAYVRSSPAFLAVADRQPQEMVLEHCDVG